jgi:hypothetical protein
MGDESTRAYVVRKFSELLDIPETSTLCINLEKSLNNWAVRRAKSLLDEPAWDNHTFTNRYKHKFLELQSHIRKVDTLREDIRSGKIKPRNLWKCHRHIYGPVVRTMQHSQNIFTGICVRLIWLEKAKISRVSSLVTDVSRRKRHIINYKREAPMNQ